MEYSVLYSHVLVTHQIQIQIQIFVSLKSPAGLFQDVTRNEAEGTLGAG